MSEVVEEYIEFENEENVVWQFDENNIYKQYRLNTMIAGDTDSTYNFLPEEAYEGLTDDEIVIFCDEVGEIANSTFPDYVKRIFNCPDERLDIIKTEREAVSDKSFFVTKKRYAMHVINIEGTPVDDLKIAGLEVKKANTSNIVRKFLSEIIDMVLNSRDMDYVLNRIDGMEEEFRQAPIEDLATTLNAKTLIKAQETYELTGAYKGIHYASKAAIEYNIRCGVTDRTVVAGDKISIVYVTTPVGVIGYPADMTTLPNWLHNDIGLDYDKMWEKAHKTITNYLKAMGWDIASRKDALREELFGF